MSFREYLNESSSAKLEKALKNRFYDPENADFLKSVELELTKYIVSKGVAKRDAAEIAEGEMEELDPTKYSSRDAKKVIKNFDDMIADFKEDM